MDKCKNKYRFPPHDCKLGFIVAMLPILLPFAHIIDNISLANRAKIPARQGSNGIERNWTIGRNDLLRNTPTFFFCGIA